MASYKVKEIYYTLQGEGAHTGRAAIFLRFTGCNLWSGHEKDRDTAICQFCDTDFVGTDGTYGGTYGRADELASTVANIWQDKVTPDIRTKPYVVCTGGEPLLQLDQALVDALHKHSFEVAIETNGTRETPENLDWICVSPKAGAPLILKEGNELKLVFPQEKLDPNSLTSLAFEHFFLQPMDGIDVKLNTELALDYCKLNPPWQVSIQMHKVMGLP